jgi:hypothetical protein
MKVLRDLVLAVGAGIAVHRVLRAKSRSERRARRARRHPRWLGRALELAGFHGRGNRA